MKKLLLLLWIIPCLAFGQGKTIAFQKNMMIFNGQQSTYYLDTSSTAQAKSGDLSLGGSLNFTGTYTDDVIDFSNITIDYTGSSGPAPIRMGTYGSPMTNADEDQSGLLRLYGQTSANGSSYDRGVFVALKTTGTKGVYPIAGLAEVLAQSGAGPTSVTAGQFIADLHTTDAVLAATTGGGEGMFGGWFKVTAIDGATTNANSVIAPIWVDNQLYGNNASTTTKEYGIRATAGGTLPKSFIGFETSSVGWDQLLYFDATAYDQKPVSNTDFLKVLLNATQYYIPLSSTNSEVSYDGPIDLTIINTGAGGDRANNTYISQTTNALTGELIGIKASARVNVASSSGTVRGGHFAAGNMDAGYAVNTATGVYAEVTNKIPSGAVTWTNARGVEINMDLDQGTSGNANTITNAYMIYGVYNLPTVGTYATVTNGYGLFLRNEAVGGTGQLLDAAIYVDDLNHSGGIKGWDYGIDFSGIGANSGSFGTADIRLATGAKIDNGTDDLLTIEETVVQIEGNLTFDNDALLDNIRAGNLTITEDTVEIDGVLMVTGTISGLTCLVLDTDPTITLATADCQGQVRYNNDADVIDYTLPGAVKGLTIIFFDIGGGVITVDPVDGTDTIYLNGTTVGAGDAIDSPGAVGDFICLQAIDDTRWVTIGRSGVWIDGGAD